VSAVERALDGAVHRVPGDWMLHPLPLGAAALLALNDRVLKAAYGAWWTGKLSDIGGLLFFPWLLLAAWELGCWGLGRPWRAQPLALAVCVGLTGVGFALINVSESAGTAYEAVVGCIWHALAVDPGSWLFAGRVRHTVDPTDLLALPALWVSWAVGMRRIRACEVSEVAAPGVRQPARLEA
jgi:hypothetical protein